jgi:autotransporter-associated beta strand protein
MLHAAALAGVGFLASSPVLWANSGVTVTTGTSDLQSLGATGSSDLVFATSLAYSPTTFNVGSASLPLGTIDDLDTTQTLTITDAAGSITLNGGTNSQPGGLPQTTDLLYVASGGTLSMNGTPLTFAAAASGSTIDVNGVANIGTLNSTSGNTFTLNGTGQVNVTVNNLATNLANFVVASGTLSNNATSALGAGTLYLGATTGSANAAIIDSTNVNLTTPIVVQAGSTGTLRLAGGLAGGTSPSFTGTITLNGNVTFGSGNTGTIYNQYMRGQVAGAGNVTIDAGIGTVDYYNSAGSYTYSGTTTIADGTLQLSGTISSSGFTLGTPTGTQNAAITLSGGVANTLSVVAGDTGTLRIGSTSGQTYSGVITVASGATLTLGNGGASTNGLLIRTGDFAAASAGNVVIDAGAASVNYYDNNATGYAYSGLTYIASGTLTADQNVGAGTIYLGTSTGTLNAEFLSGYGTSGVNPINVVAGDTGRLTIATANGRTINQNIDLNNNVTFGEGDATNYQATIRNANVLGTGNITVNAGTAAGTFGTNYFKDQDASNFTGWVLANQGDFILNKSTALTANNPLGISSGGSADVQTSVTIAGLEDGSALSGGSSTGTLLDNTTSNTTLTFGGTSGGVTYSFSGALAQPSTGSLSLATASTFAGTELITASNTVAGTVNVAGGTLALTGNDTFAGNVTLNGGTLILNGTNTFSGASGAAVVTTGTLSTNNLASGIGNTGTITLGTGTLLYTGTSTSLTQAVSGTTGYSINVSQPATTLTSSGTLSAGLDTAGAGTFLYSPSTTASLSNLTITSGIFDDESPNAAQLTNSVTINGGTFLEGSGNRSTTDLIHFNATVALNTGGTYDLNGHALEEFRALNGTGGVVTNGDAGTTSTLILGANGGGGSFGGIIQNGLGTVGFTKETSLVAGGSQTLAGSSSYTGTTLVSGGTLDVTGSIAGSGTINVTATGSSNSPTLQLDGANALSPTAPITASATGAALPVINVNASQSLGNISNVGTLNFNTGTINAGTINDPSVGLTSVLNVGSTAFVSATNIRHGVVNINSGGTVVIPSNPAGAFNPTSPTPSPTISVVNDLYNNGGSTSLTSGTLDLKNNALIVNDPSEASSIIAAVYNAADFNPSSGSNQWDKPGITSSSAQANASSYALGSLTGPELTNLGSTTFQGLPVTSNSTVVSYTLIGDTELRGTVDGTDYNNVLANYDTAGDWSQGNFYNESIVSGDDYNAVLNVYDVAASGAAKGLKPAITRSLSPALSPVATSGTFHLEVNTTSGDVVIFNDSTSSAPLTLYNIVDGSQQDLLIGNPADGNGTSTSINSGSAPYTNEHFLSVAQNDSNAVASITGRSSTNYKAWSLVLDGYNSNATALALSEGGQANKTDTINVPSYYSIDLGDIFNVGTTTVALTFQWGTETSSGGEGGTVYSNQPIDYVGAPEPASLGLLGLGGLAMMRRRRKA